MAGAEPADDPAGDPAGEARARLRFERWRTLPAFHAPGATDERALSPLGVTPDELLALLSESDASLARRFPEAPRWVHQLETWWEEGVALLKGHEGHDAEVPDLRLLSAVLPLVLGARAELADRLERSLDAADDPGLTAGTLRRDLLNSLVDDPPMAELSLVLAPTMVLEVNVARERGRLDGSTPQERFESFVQQNRDPHTARMLLDEYPVLLRAAVERLAFWIDRRVDFADHLVADFAAVQEAFLRGVPTKMTVAFGQGDSHRQGRSVAIVRSDVGSVVYKPRSTGMDEAYSKAVDWFNAAEPPLRLSVPRFLSRPGYGWFEFVETHDIPDDAAADRCVWRMGATNAILHVLRATDMHYENVLISGEHPYPVDLESLLHTDKRYANTEMQAVPNVANLALSDSALAVGILPNKIITGKDGSFEATDITPLGVHHGQLGAIAMPTLFDGESDTIRVVTERPSMDGPGHTDESEGVDHGHPTGYLLRPEPFDQGFTYAYRLVTADTPRWLGPAGVLAEFATTTTRYIPRPTMVYAKVLTESYHPDFMRDALDRAMCLGKLLAGYWDRPLRDGVVAAEIADLLVGDIPFFEIDATTGEIVRDTGQTAIARDGKAPLADVAELVEELCDADLAVQRQIIRYSFASALVTQPRRHEEPVPAVPAVPARAREDEKISAAVEVAEQLVERMIRRREGVGWLSLTAVGEKHWVVSPTVMDLYAGLSGIGLALSAVGAIASHDRITSVAQEVMDQVLTYDPLILFDERSVAKTREAFGTGAYGHLTGMAVALADAAARFDRPDYLDCSLRSVELMSHLIDSDTHSDVVAGNAGALLGVLAVMGRTTVPDGLRTVRRLADQLVERGIERDGTWAWPQSDGGVPLVGLSHGTTGIALALARAGRLLDDPSLSDVAAGALAYDRQHLVASTGDWRDLRTAPTDQGSSRADAAGPEQHMRAWCHGSPGAGLGRSEILALDLLPSHRPLLEVELAIARASTAEAVLVRPDRPVGAGNHSLCHGDVGNLLALEAMVRTTDADADVAELTGSTWAALAHRGRQTGWECGVPGGVPVPGLMMGLAGIAWGFAFSARPAGELDVLTLRPAGRSVDGAADGPGGGVLTGQEVLT